MNDIPDTPETIAATEANPAGIDSLRAQIESQQQQIEQLESRLADPPAEPAVTPSAQAPRAANGTAIGAQRERAAIHARATGRRNDVLTYMRLRRG